MCATFITLEIATVTVRPNHDLSYAIGTDFCLEHVESFQGGINVHCHLSNVPVPAPTFNMTVATIGEDGTIKLLSRKSEILFLNKTMLKTLFNNDSMVNVSCMVSNSFGSDILTTLIRVCGECNTFQSLLFDKKNFTIIIKKGPTECQDGVTNNCSQACIRDFLGRYECSCNDGYALHMDACVGEFRVIQIKNIT